MNDYSNGIFEHYKGGFYRLLFIAKESSDHATEVAVYVSLATGSIWTRPLEGAPGVDAWMDFVDWPDGVKRMRFCSRGASDLAGNRRPVFHVEYVGPGVARYSIDCDVCGSHIDSETRSGAVAGFNAHVCTP